MRVGDSIFEDTLNKATKQDPSLISRYRKKYASMAAKNMVKNHAYKLYGFSSEDEELEPVNKVIIEYYKNAIALVSSLMNKESDGYELEMIDGACKMAETAKKPYRAKVLACQYLLQSWLPEEEATMRFIISEYLTLLLEIQEEIDTDDISNRVDGDIMQLLPTPSVESKILSKIARKTIKSLLKVKVPKDSAEGDTPKEGSVLAAFQ